MRRLVILLLLLAPLSLVARNIYVVSVGICRYQYIKPLRKAENDARSMADLYKTHTSQVTLLTGSQATHDQILTTMAQVFGQASEDDVVVLFFSGHGSPGGLCAYDTHDEQTLVSYDEVKNVLRQCRAANKQLFIDACFAGGLRSKGTSATAASSLGQTEGVMLFLSSRTSETSRENPYGTNGFFTQYLVRGLKGGADTNRDRIVGAKEIFDFVSAKVKTATHDKQHPVMWGRFSDTMHILNWNPAK